MPKVKTVFELSADNKPAERHSHRQGPVEPGHHEEPSVETHQELNAEISRLKRMKLDLQESETFSRAVFEASQTGLLVVDPRTRQIMDSNRAAADILCQSADELTGTLASDYLPTGQRNLLKISDEQTRNFETTMMTADGQSISVIRSISLIEGDRTQLAVISFLDISRLKEAEAEIHSSHHKLRQAHEELERHKDQIVQSEKLASIGQLAAGVAHEINNPIGFVTSNLGTVQEYLTSLVSVLKLYEERDELDTAETEKIAVMTATINATKEEEDIAYICEDLENVVNESLDGVGRVAEIVQSLKSFAREDSQQASAYDVNEGVEAMIKMAWNELKYSCQVERKFGTVPSISCHAGRVNQVIMNMLVNAAQAMPEAGGQITLSTGVQDQEVVITIADTGNGIPPQNLTRIFDPFFTTKEVGSGTGLGLSISHGIIQEHGGRIEVESIVGEGTTFRIILPLTAAPTEELIG